MATEKRQIDANALVEKFRDRKDLFLNKMGGFQALLQREKGRVDELDNCIAAVINAPTVDSVEVVHGNWVYYSTSMQECSNCKRHTARHKFKYCPYCGAVMGDKLHYAID